MENMELEMAGMSKKRNKVDRKGTNSIMEDI